MAGYIIRVFKLPYCFKLHVLVVSSRLMDPRQ